MNKSDPRASRSRRALMDAAISILPLNIDATLSEIAEQAGVGRATLYRHFETREQLILELAIESLEETDKACAHIQEKDMKGRQAIEEIFRSVMPLADRFHFLLMLWSIVQENKKIDEIYRQQLARLEVRIVEAKKEKSIKKSLPDEWLICLIDSLIYSGWFCIGTQTISVEKAAELSISTFFDGVG